jgi:hypothetical protein
MFRIHVLCSVTFFFRKSCHLWDNVEKYCRAGQATDDKMAHAHSMLDTSGYKNTLRIRNTYCFSTATMVMRTHLGVTLYVQHIAYLVVSTERIYCSIILFDFLNLLKIFFPGAYSEYNSIVVADNLKDLHYLLVRYVWHKGISYKICWYVYVCFMSLIFYLLQMFQTGCGAHAASYSKVTGVLLQWYSSLWKSGVIPLLFHIP